MLDAIGADLSNYTMAVVLAVIGFSGAYAHFAKDRYLENKICCSFRFYLTNDTKTTYNMLKGIAASAVPLAIAHSGGFIPSLAEVYAAFCAGYGSDSIFNHAYSKTDE